MSLDKEDAIKFGSGAGSRNSFERFFNMHKISLSFSRRTLHSHSADGATEYSATTTRLLGLGLRPQNVGLDLGLEAVALTTS